jgi:hypothetical protein
MTNLTAATTRAIKASTATKAYKIMEKITKGKARKRINHH